MGKTHLNKNTYNSIGNMFDKTLPTATHTITINIEHQHQQPFGDNNENTLPNKSSAESYSIFQMKGSHNKQNNLTKKTNTQKHHTTKTNKKTTKMFKLLRLMGKTNKTNNNKQTKMLKVLWLKLGLSQHSLKIIVFLIFLAFPDQPK